MSATGKTLERVRHELKFRICETVSMEYLTPKMIRVKVTSPDLEGFKSLAYDDHVKLFFATDGNELILPVSGPNGLQYPDHLPMPDARDYTPRYFDTKTNTLTLDFVVHGNGPAITWAREAKSGSKLGIGGLRASFVLSADFDWYLLIGDETALPAIGRQIEELPSGKKVIALIEIADKSERQNFQANADVDIHWLERDGRPTGETGLLIDAVRALDMPVGDGYVFVAGEASVSKNIRTHMTSERDHNPDWIKAAGYWHLGESDIYDGHEH
ncbi:MAG: siderophore-interacting protein [Rhizobiaceae bacterium]|nr:siderophore-interacting protein [Rhizobiaceae bacterium]